MFDSPWTPWVLFFVATGIAAFVQRAYFDELAKHGDAVRSDNDFADTIRQRPIELPIVLRREVVARFRALATRQQDPGLERRRLLAFVSVVAAISCFLWLVVSSGNRSS